MTITAKAKYATGNYSTGGRIRVTWTDPAGRKHTRHVGFDHTASRTTRQRDAVALAMGVSPDAVTSTDVMDASHYELFTVEVQA